MSIRAGALAPHLGDVDAILRDADTAIRRQARWPRPVGAVHGGRPRRGNDQPRDHSPTGSPSRCRRTASSCTTNRWCTPRRTGPSAPRALLRPARARWLFLYRGGSSRRSTATRWLPTSVRVPDHALRQQAVWRRSTRARHRHRKASPRQPGHGRFVERQTSSCTASPRPPHARDRGRARRLVETAPSTRSPAQRARHPVRHRRLRHGYSSLSHHPAPHGRSKIDRSRSCSRRRRRWRGAHGRHRRRRSSGRPTPSPRASRPWSSLAGALDGRHRLQGFLLGRPEEPLDVPSRRSATVDTTGQGPGLPGAARMGR